MGQVAGLQTRYQKFFKNSPSLQKITKKCLCASSARFFLKQIHPYLRRSFHSIGANTTPQVSSAQR
jgi:hypothetical protein